MMTRAFLFLGLSICLVACGSKNPDFEDFNTINLNPGNALVETYNLDESTQDVLDYVGVEVLSRYKVKLKSTKTHYFKFVSIIELPKSEDGRYMSQNAEILSLQSFDKCFFYKDEEAEVHNEELNFDFSIDYRMNDILNNDSLYFSTHGRDFSAIKTPVTIASHEITEHDQTIQSDDYPISLFRAQVRSDHMGEESLGYLFFGMMVYDCNKKYDFQTYFESPDFLAYAMYGPQEVNESIVYNDKLRLDNYIKE